MSQDRPTAPELLDAIGAFLEDAILPLCRDGDDPARAYHTRIAINLLAILAREWRAGPAADAAERDRLKALLGRDEPLEMLNRRLAEGLRSGELDPGDATIRAHLRATVIDKLRIANPRYLDHDDRSA